MENDMLHFMCFIYLTASYIFFCFEIKWQQCFICIDIYNQYLTSIEFLVVSSHHINNSLANKEETIQLIATGILNRIGHEFNLNLAIFM